MICVTVKLWAVRTARGLSLRELARLSGLSKTVLNDIENGRTSPTLAQLAKIAAALNTKISHLYDECNM